MPQPAVLKVIIADVGIPQHSQGIPIGGAFKIGDRNIISVFPNLGAFLSTLIPNFYVFAGILLFLLLIFGGFTYIVNAGQQNPEGVQKGKKAITAALIGFLLVFTSWWIVQIIEIITGINILGE